MNRQLVVPEQHGDVTAPAVEGALLARTSIVRVVVPKRDSDATTLSSSLARADQSNNVLASQRVAEVESADADAIQNSSCSLKRKSSKRKSTMEDDSGFLECANELLSEARQRASTIQQPAPQQDEDTAFGNLVATELRRMTNQQVKVEKKQKICSILFALAVENTKDY